MDEDDRVLRIFVKKIDELTSQRKKLDDQIAAMALAYESIAGSPLESFEDRPVERKNGKARTLDKASREKTLAFLRERIGKPTTTNTIARQFKITKEAASQRCGVLVKSGLVRRISRGVFTVDKKVEPS